MRNRTSAMFAAVTVAATMITVAPSTRSAAAPAPATTAPAPAPGIYMVWGSQGDANLSYVHGGQIVFNWSDIETSRGTFAWNSPKKEPRMGLAAQLQVYHNLGKQATIQVDSSQKPSWIYDYRILKCGTRAVGNYPGSTPYDVPQYWAANYQPIMQEMLSSLASEIRKSPYKDAVAGIRSAPDLIGTEHWSLDDPLVSLPGTVGALCRSQWTPSIGQQVYAKVMQMYYNIFEPDIRPVLRADFFTALGSYNANPATYLGRYPRKTQAWFFVTSGDPDSSLSNKNPFFYAWARTGSGVAYSESVLNSMRFTDPVSWNYWRQLMELDRGVSYVATYGDDLLLGQTNPEYLAAFDFTNKYAGYTAAPAQSPGAWVAFSPEAASQPPSSTSGCGGTPSPSTVGNTHGNLGWLVTQYNADGTPGGDTATVGCNSLDPSGNNPGSTMIGPADQRYGRYARRTDVAAGRTTFFLRLDGTFKASLGSAVKINVTYLDQGLGSFVVKWGTGVKEQQKVTKQNSGRWVTYSIGGIPANSFVGHLAVSSDITLSATTEDTTFHMVEVTR